MITATVLNLADTINVNPQAPPGSSKFLLLLSWVGWLAMIGAVAALVIIGGKFGFEKRQGTADSESAERATKALIGCVVIGIAGGLVGALV
ncbi:MULTISPECIES: hypothetical protein [Gordonia]|jgi:hypothetical protein|uniref:Uncharacterized protein n=1 Tax=Gordonia sihwensis NBRC 108236 TaxID=1223544 RepID=L7LQH9_9ACTN|nr:MULTISPECIES: hypothetical protein [Gordonia]AUH70579.1 hypothetical protein CXX93_19385 [Gordonia sp. YC-JH1]WFN95159.1 hypothetical protein P5P27_20555 [Gordonia sihwensis]GAC62348.1 hypothetical protein GSI01S_33_00340 [Gordonia sihwensis NBRC 108236]